MKLNDDIVAPLFFQETEIMQIYMKRRAENVKRQSLFKAKLFISE